MKKAKKTISIDASGKIYGRLASEVAALIRGKNSPTFAPHTLPEIYVEIKNIKKIKFTGKKWDQKLYHTHTLHPGGYATTKLSETFMKQPEKTFMKTIRLMLPSNKLRKDLLKHISFT